MRHKHLFVILVLLAVALPESPAHAGGVVSVCDEAHLRAALAGGGTVTFACSGTITLTAEIVIAADTTIDGSGQTVTISGNNAVRVFTVNSGIALNIERLIIANGTASVYGGGISNSGTVHVSDSTFTSNRAGSDGGGIWNYGGTLTVSNSTFAGNTATYAGGGIMNFNGGTLTVSNSTFSGNSAQPTGGGGGIANSGTLTIINSSFYSNSAGTSGGGISNGAFHTLTVSNSTFSGNSASRGGGIANNVSSLVTVSNSTFFGNSATLQGGGIYNYVGTATVSNSTLSGNGANTGGGIYNQSGSTLALMNTIVANSPTGGDCFGEFTDGGGNVSYPIGGCPGTNADPRLGSLQDNGGPTETMALDSGSIAIDFGVDATCAGAPVNNLDQLGVIRPQGSYCDSGAFEWVCPSFVPPATVDVEDIVAMATHWGWTSSTPGWDPVYDLNLDSKIDIVDIVLVTAAWGRTCS